MGNLCSMLPLSRSTERRAVHWTAFSGDTPATLPTTLLVVLSCLGIDHITYFFTYVKTRSLLGVMCVYNSAYDYSAWTSLASLSLTVFCVAVVRSKQLFSMSVILVFRCCVSPTPLLDCWLSCRVSTLALGLLLWPPRYHCSLARHDRSTVPQEAPPKQKPKTLESTRDPDRTVVKPADDEVFRDEAEDEFAKFFSNEEVRLFLCLFLCLFIFSSHHRNLSSACSHGCRKKLWQQLLAVFGGSALERFAFCE